MVCPKCGSKDIGVIDSRPVRRNGNRRRRVCNQCAHRWTTLEFPVKVKAGRPVADELLILPLSTVFALTGPATAGAGGAGLATCAVRRPQGWNGVNGQARFLVYCPLLVEE